LALATLDMFEEGLFSSDVALPHRVNHHGVKLLSFKAFCKGLQVNDKANPLLGAKDRFDMIQRFADALKTKSEFFGEEVVRPGNMVDYVLKHSKDNKVSVRVVWKAVIEGLEQIWPVSTSGVACVGLTPVDTGIKRGDVWIYSPLKEIGRAASDMIPFHKLSQWLTYSLLEPIESLGLCVEDMHLLTGLAEYRNGGLFVDMGVLTLRNASMNPPSRVFDPGSELIVEWRALTLCLLDLVGEQAARELGKTQEEFPLARILQGGTWAAGRIVAAQKRPDSKDPPIKVRSNGTVF